VRIMIAHVDPLAADADPRRRFLGWYPSVKIFGRRWVRYGELTFRPRLTIGGAG